MDDRLNTGRAQWSSSTSYLLVTIGGIVGIGNILQFPFLVSQYGGIFVLLCLLCDLAIALPLLLTELSIGRRGKQNPVGALEILALESGRSTRWRWIGWICATISVLTFAYYAVLAAFPLEYFLKSVVMAVQMVQLPEDVVAATWGNHFFALEACFAFFVVMVLLVISRGINRGLENISRITVPLYCFILLILAVYAGATGDLMAALHHLVAMPTHTSLIEVFFAALLFAFFKLNVGMGSMIVYGSYLPYSVPLGRSTLIIVIADAIIALLAYLVIFPLVFAQGGLTVLGEKLTNFNIVFVFAHGSHFITAALFFFAAVLMALTPMIAMAETVTVTLIERFHIQRVSAAKIVGLFVLIVGSIWTLFHTTLIDEKLFGNIELYDTLKMAISEFITPISALLIAIFAGWVIKSTIFSSELKFNPILYSCWRWSLRYLAPLAILLILLWNILEAVTFSVS